MSFERRWLLLLLIFSPPALANEIDRIQPAPLTLMSDTFSFMNQVTTPQPYCFELPGSPAECAQADSGITHVMWIDDMKERQKESEQVQKWVDACEAKKFASCYSSLKPSIDRSQLDQMISSCVQDKSCRMPDPMIFCYNRAYLLSKRLTDAGYATQILAIGDAPTLIAIPLDQDGKPKNNYYDYQGVHYVVAINVTENGKTELKVVDPQFTNAPMSVKDYFVRTMGRECKLVKKFHQRDSGLPLQVSAPADYWNCEYELHPGNWVARAVDQPQSHFSKSNDLNSRCGWPLVDQMREDVYHMGSVVDDHAGMSLATKFPTGLVNHPDAYKTVILNAYDAKAQEMRGSIDDIAVFRKEAKAGSVTSPFGTMMVSRKDLNDAAQNSKRLKKLLEQYPAFRAQVERNLQSAGE